jgi:hypothetical protein
MKLRQYSDKSIVITCDDNGGESYEKDIEYLTGIGGKFNKFLKGGEGFIFPNYRRKEIENYMATSAARGGSILGQTSMTALANGPLRVAAPLVTEGSVLGDLGSSEGGGGDLGLAAARGGDRDACFTEGTSSRHAPATRVPGGPILGPKEACNCIVYIKMLTEKLEIAHLKIEKIEEEILNIKKNKYPKKVNIIDLCDAVFDDDQPVRKRLLR